MTCYLLTRVTHGQGTVTLTLQIAEGGAENAQSERLFLTERSYDKLGAPKKGTILSEESAEALRTAHRRYEAVRRATSILAYADNSEAMLLHKLRARNIRGEDAAFALAYVKAKGLIRERDQLERLVTRLANERLYGRSRILRALRGKGYRTADIEACIDALCADGTLDFDRIRRTLLEKKAPKDDLERKKLLYTHGFGEY